MPWDTKSRNPYWRRCTKKGVRVITDMQQILRQYFGYDTFRPLQAEIIKNVLQKKDTLVLMPTGGGKSLCFQLPALMFPGLTLVISPLISLMKDQVDALKANGVKAAFLNSSLSSTESALLHSEIRQGKVKILYIAPERLALPFFKSFLGTLSLSLIAVDEAHCISEWGHDFRPEYRNLKSLRVQFADVPVIALTATATIQVRYDIRRELALKQPKVFISSFNRPNLSYHILPKKDTFFQLCNLLQRHDDESVIIYCFSRNGTEKLVSDLNKQGFKALPYHAGLSNEERKRIQEAFIKDEARIIAATIAFGMGIDKPDVRLVVHYDLPKSLEGYYQETGRAGRDGLSSLCILFYSYGDTIKHNYFIQQMRDFKEQSLARQKLQQMLNFCTHKACRRSFLLRYFGEKVNFLKCDNCDVCAPQTELIVQREKTKKRKEILTYEPIENADFSEPVSIAEQNTEYDRELFEKLRKLRKKLADERRVPPFVIFGDRTLQEITHALPQNKDGFSSIFGVGRQKLEEFGEIFTAAVREHALKHGLVLESKRFSSGATEKTAEASNTFSASTYEETRKLIIEKKSLQEITTSRKLKPATILRHIEILVRKNNNLSIEHLRPDSERFVKVKAAFQKTGNWNLSPVKSLLDASYTYDEIQLIRIFLFREL